MVHCQCTMVHWQCTMVHCKCTMIHWQKHFLWDVCITPDYLLLIYNKHSVRKLSRKSWIHFLQYYIHNHIFSRFILNHSVIPVLKELIFWRRSFKISREPWEICFQCNTCWLAVPYTYTQNIYRNNMLLYRRVLLYTAMIK